MPFISSGGGLFCLFGFFSSFITVRFEQGTDKCSKQDQLNEMHYLYFKYKQQTTLEKKKEQHIIFKYQKFLSS